VRSHEQFASRIVRLSEVLPSSTWDCTARHCMDAIIAVGRRKERAVTGACQNSSTSQKRAKRWGDAVDRLRCMLGSGACALLITLGLD
jgi:hypothetical protein